MNSHQLASPRTRLDSTTAVRIDQLDARNAPGQLERTPQRAVVPDRCQLVARKPLHAQRRGDAAEQVGDEAVRQVDGELGGVGVIEHAGALRGGQLPACLDEPGQGEHVVGQGLAAGEDQAGLGL